MLRLALEQDAEYKIALSEYQAIVESLPLAISERRPQVDLSANIPKRGTDGFSDSANTSDSYVSLVDFKPILSHAHSPSNS